LKIENLILANLSKDKGAKLKGLKDIPMAASCNYEFEQDGGI
jgi:hypothetical protein